MTAVTGNVNATDITGEVFEAYTVGETIGSDRKLRVFVPKQIIYKNWNLFLDIGTVIGNRYPDYGDKNMAVSDRFFLADITGTNAIITKFTVQQHGTTAIATQYVIVNKTTSTTLSTVNVGVGTNQKATSTTFTGTINANDELYFEVVSGDTGIGAELLVTYYEV